MRLRTAQLGVWCCVTTGAWVLVVLLMSSRLELPVAPRGLPLFALVMIAGIELLYSASARGVALIWRRNEQDHSTVPDAKYFVVAGPYFPRWAAFYVAILIASPVLAFIGMWLLFSGAMGYQSAPYTVATLVAFMFVFPALLPSRRWGIVRLTRSEIAVEWGDGAVLTQGWTSIPRLEALMDRAPTLGFEARKAPVRRFGFVGRSGREGYRVAAEHWKAARPPRAESLDRGSA